MRYLLVLFVLGQLPKASFSEKETILENISAIKIEQTPQLLNAILEGELFYRKKDSRIVYASKAESGYDIRDAITDEDLGNAGKRKVKKISVNNSLRRLLKSLISRFELESEDANVRISASLLLKILLKPQMLIFWKLLKERFLLRKMLR
jgi:urea transport system permease protein